jgi:hypothetical protein
VVVSIEGQEPLEADYLLVSVGRRAYTQGMGFEEAGIRLERGVIQVDERYHTGVANVYAIGDAIGGRMLAHKAEEEGIAAVENAAGKHGHVNYDAVANIVYTWPEIASVGATEEELKEKGVAYRTGKFPFAANGRAKAMAEPDGFVKILADAATDRILGAHILGSARLGPDRAARHRAGVRGLGGGHRALGARAPDAAGGGQGSGARRRREDDPPVGNHCVRGAPCATVDVKGRSGSGSALRVSGIGHSRPAAVACAGHG